MISLIYKKQDRVILKYFVTVHNKRITFILLLYYKINYGSKGSNM